MRNEIYDYLENLRIRGFEIKAINFDEDYLKAMIAKTDNFDDLKWKLSRGVYEIAKRANILSKKIALDIVKKFDEKTIKAFLNDISNHYKNVSYLSNLKLIEQLEDIILYGMKNDSMEIHPLFEIVKVTFDENEYDELIQKYGEVRENYTKNVNMVITYIASYISDLYKNSEDEKIEINMYRDIDILVDYMHNLELSKLSTFELKSIILTITSSSELTEKLLNKVEQCLGIKIKKKKEIINKIKEGGTFEFKKR